MKFNCLYKTPIIENSNILLLNGYIRTYHAKTLFQ